MKGWKPRHASKNLLQKLGNVRSCPAIDCEEFVLVQELVRKVYEDITEPLVIVLAFQERVDDPDAQRMIKAEIVLSHFHDDLTRVVDQDKPLIEARHS